MVSTPTFPTFLHSDGPKSIAPSNSCWNTLYRRQEVREEDVLSQLMHLFFPTPLCNSERWRKNSPGCTQESERGSHQLYLPAMSSEIPSCYLYLGQRRLQAVPLRHGWAVLHSSLWGERPHGPGGLQMHGHGRRLPGRDHCLQSHAQQWTAPWGVSGGGGNGGRIAGDNRSLVIGCIWGKEPILLHCQLIFFLPSKWLASAKSSRSY